MMHKRHHGFTLIELLVAMGILMVIVLMMANLFQQSTNAWDAGLRQVEVGLEGRSALNIIQSELAHAVANSTHPFTASGSTLEFTTRAGRFADDERHYRRVRYTQSGAVLRKTTTAYMHNGATAVDSSDLVERVEDFSVDTPDGNVTGVDYLPLWVQMSMRLTPLSGENAIVRVSSQGADGVPNTDDDRLLRSWE